MDSFSVAAGAVAPLMFFMALGFCVSRKAHFDSAAIANFNKLVFKVFLPANMFAAVYFSDMSKLLDPKLISYAIGGVLGIYLLAYFLLSGWLRTIGNGELSSRLFTAVISSSWEFLWWRTSMARKQ